METSPETLEAVLDALKAFLPILKDWILPFLSPAAVYFVARQARKLDSKKRADSFLLELYQRQFDASLKVFNVTRPLVEIWIQYLAKEITWEEAVEAQGAITASMREIYIALPQRVLVKSLQFEKQCTDFENEGEPTDTDLVIDHAEWVHEMHMNLLAEARLSLRIDDSEAVVYDELLPWLLAETQRLKEAQKRHAS